MFSRVGLSGAADPQPDKRFSENVIVTETRVGIALHPWVAPGSEMRRSNFAYGVSGAIGGARRSGARERRPR